MGHSFFILYLKFLLQIVTRLFNLTVNLLFGYSLIRLNIEKGQLMEKAISVCTSPQPCHGRLVWYGCQKDIQVVLENINVVRIYAPELLW